MTPLDYARTALALIGLCWLVITAFRFFSSRFERLTRLEWRVKSQEMTLENFRDQVRALRRDK